MLDKLQENKDVLLVTRGIDTKTRIATSTVLVTLDATHSDMHKIRILLHELHDLQPTL